MILLWRITTLCNFACGFCAYDRRLVFPRTSADPGEVERVTLLAADLALRRGERLLVSWLGGEPLLWPPLLDLSARLARHPAVSISATTNGSRLLAGPVQAGLLAHFSELTLSIDGPAAVHDRLRGAPGSYGRMQRAATALAAGRRAGRSRLKLRANSVLMRETVGQFPALCRTLAGWGVDEITFNQLGGRDRPAFFAGQALTPADVAAIRRWLPGLRAELAERGVRLCASQSYLDRIEASSRGESLAGIDCRPGESFLFIDEHGIMAPCSFTTGDYGVPVGDLASVADLAALPARFAHARADRRNPVCDDCPSTQLFGKFAA